MLPFFFSFFLAQTMPNPAPATQEEIVQPQEVRPLPGQLDRVPVFNSNSPEVVLTEGILLSTFPPEGKQTPAAHLNFRFQGRFDIFTHHIARATPPEDTRTLYVGILLHNPSTQPVTVDVLQGASYLSQPDAPFIEMPSYLENDLGTVYAGPGSRVMNEVLRGQRQADLPPQLVIPPGQSRMLQNVPIPVQTLVPKLNGRSTLIRLRSDGPVYAASLGMYGPMSPDGSDTPTAGWRDRAPTLEEWENLLKTGNFAGPRDRAPTPPGTTPIIYGRVAGVAQGSRWQAQVTDRPDLDYLSIPQAGQAFSYVLSTVPGGTLGTGQVHSAPMMRRYSDTGYQAHGNYGIEYNLTLPLYNNTGKPQTVTVAVQTPVKQEQLTQGGLRFFQPPAPQTFFRGTVRVRYNDDRGLPRTRYVHLVQRRGQQGEPLAILNLKAGDRSLVQVDFLYPPDATPPQVLTVRTLETPTIPSN